MGPAEFNPELNEKFLQNLMGRVNKREAERVGQAKSEAIARGLSGDPFEGSLIGTARGEADEERRGIESDFFYNLANMNREERLGQQQRGYQVEDRNFAAAQADADRQFRERLAKYGYENDARNARSNLWGSVIGGGLGAIGTIGGALAGGPAGAAGGGAISKSMADYLMNRVYNKGGRY